MLDPRDLKTDREVVVCDDCGAPLSARRFDHPPVGQRIEECPRCGHDSFDDLRREERTDDRSDSAPEGIAGVVAQHL